MQPFTEHGKLKCSESRCPQQLREERDCCDVLYVENSNNALDPIPHDLSGRTLVPLLIRCTNITPFV